NVYTKNAINEDGTVKIVTADEIVFDTLPNGKIIARDLPGEIAQVPVDEEETYLRQNFDRSDNRNFRDGDKQSSRQYRESFIETDEDGVVIVDDVTSKMYNSPKHNVHMD